MWGGLGVGFVAPGASALVFLEASDVGEIGEHGLGGKEAKLSWRRREMWEIQCHTNQWWIKRGQLSPESGHISFWSLTFLRSMTIGDSSGPLVPSCFGPMSRMSGAQGTPLSHLSGNWAATCTSWFPLRLSAWSQVEIPGYGSPTCPVTWEICICFSIWDMLSVRKPANLRIGSWCCEGWWWPGFGDRRERQLCTGVFGGDGYIFIT